MRLTEAQARKMGLVPLQAPKVSSASSRKALASPLVQVSRSTAPLLETVSFALAIRPRGKAAMRRDPRSTGVYMSAADERYRKAVALAARRAMGDRPPHSGAFDVAIKAEFALATSWSNKKKESALLGELPCTIKPDIDNCCKAVFDSLTGICIEDDRFAVSSHLTKSWASQDRLVVAIRPWCPGQSMSELLAALEAPLVSLAGLDLGV